MTRRALLIALPLGLMGCATAKLATKPEPVKAYRCVVCGVALDTINWYGIFGPYCQKHLEEAIAKDQPKKGLVG